MKLHNQVMKLRSFPTLIFTLLLVSFMMQSCSWEDEELPPLKGTEARLQQLNDSLFNHFSSKWGIKQGGIFMRISSPSGTYLVSSNITPPVQDNSHFRIASISKTFTAAAIMRLHQQGLLSINDIITKYLPNTPDYDIPYKDQITIKLLLQHRAGVFDVTNQDIPDTVDQEYAGKRYSDYIRGELKQDDHNFTFDELFGVIAQNGLFNHTPNAQFHYSNSGYHLLAKIVEQVTGMSFNDYITETFFEPLHLNNTYGVVSGTDQRMRDSFLESFATILDDKGSLHTFETVEDNMSSTIADGHIVSTPADISRWMELLITGQAGVSAANVALMKEMLPGDAGNERYGLGLTFDQGLGYGHDGFHASYLSRLRYDPATKTTVLVVATFIYFLDGQPQPGPEFLELAYGLRDMGIEGAQIVNH
ncbi:beta-lactamase family protein [Pontibacter sp. 172403-2]|uniref:serine hydrolase domain-containing protein n=1 Tax=Pontibacter rufus TaxID=2791028 RepID=UPI0018AFA6E1|nr:serine hydrolase domain-containing protein [Pontibacter sp. 172403-2]MBF9255755.1 beta-lactamase family protein [Pontibacter sp. 172403-2]